MSTAAGGKIDILVEPDLKGFDKKLESGLSGVIGAAGKMGAALGAAMGGAEFARNVFETGKEFQSQLNTMAAVSQASAAQLEAVQAKARELGSATDLTATSASDAAAAMTELAKGGFSVEQSMEAAKGTLQLASAAQVDAATAATIQSQALQAFSLDASEAGRVSDILAGAANASSAEMTDVSMALQQAGTVANQFGVNIDDTATAIAMFANAGITGSDAGTLLKTALLSLTDQGKPAQRAIEELGLTIYDAQGRFVGLESLMGQLNKAAASISDEQYQAATATLFGSDAMRLAGIAASQGAEQFANLRDAVTRQGQAAEVAAAQTEGLPGALERMQNTAEDAYLAVFDASQDYLVGGLDLFTKGIEKAGSALESGLGAGKVVFSGIASAAEPAASAVAGLASALEGIQTPLMAAGAVMALSKWQAFPEKVSMMGASMRASAGNAREWQQMLQKSGYTITRLDAAIYAATESTNKSVAKTATTFINAKEPLLEWRQNHINAAKTAQQAALASSNAWESADHIITQFGHRSAAGLASFAGNAKGAAAVAAQAGRSVVDFLGGPWNVALGAATIAVTAVIDAHTALAAAQDKVRESAANAAAVQRDLTLAVAGTTGALSEAGRKAAEAAAQNQLTEFMAKGQASDKLVYKVDTDEGLLGRMTFSDQYQADAEATRTRRAAYKELQDTFEELSMTEQQMYQAIAAGGPQYDALINKLRESGEAGGHAADQLAGVKRELDAQVAAAQRVEPATAQIAAGIGVLADSSASAEDRLSALKSVLEGMGMLPASAQDAMMSLAKTVDQVASSAQSAIVDGEGLGDALFDQSGKLQATDKNAQSLHDSLMSLSDRFLKAVADGNDAGEAFEVAKVGLAGLSDAYELLPDQLEALQQQYGLMPEVVETLVQLKGASDVETEVAIVWALIENMPNDKPIEMSIVSEDARRQLEELGVALDTTPDEKNTIIEARTEEARDKVKKFVDDIKDAPEEKKTKVEADVEQARRDIKSVSDDLNALKDKNITVTTTRRTVSGNTGGRASGGRVQGLAAGGNVGYRLPTTGPGTEITDGFLGVTAEGMPLSRLDGGEWVINARSARRYDRQLAAMNAGTFPDVVPGLQALETGGRVLDSAALKSKIRFMDGTPYIMGGWSPAGVDCSGAVALTINTWQGRDPFESRMSTVTEGQWLASRGAEPGQGSSGDITIGWWDQGGGINGHTAMVLADGTFVESGGNTGGGFTIGKTAGPLTGRGFTDWMHFPNADTGATSVEVTDAGGRKQRSRSAVGFGSAARTHDVVSTLMALRLNGRATGGQLPTSGPGTGTRDGFGGVDSLGMPLVRLDGGEWVINARSSQRYHHQLAAMNAGTWPDTPGLWTGGRVPGGSVTSAVSGALSGASWAALTRAAEALPGATEALNKAAEAMTGVAERIDSNPTRYGLQVASLLLPEEFTGLRDAEQGLADTRAQAHADVLAMGEAEEELREARKELEKATAEGGGMSKQAARRLEDAERDLAKARASGKADRIEAAERKLARAREDASDDIDKNGAKNAQAIKKATQRVSDAELEVADAANTVAQISGNIYAAQITMAIEAAKAIFSVVNRIIEAVNRIKTLQAQAVAESAQAMAELVSVIDEMSQATARLHIQVAQDKLAQARAQWDLSRAQFDYQKTQMDGLVNIARAQAKLEAAREQSITIASTSVAALQRQIEEASRTGIFRWQELADASRAALNEQNALQHEVWQARAEAMAAEKSSAIQLLEAHKASAIAALQAASSVRTLQAQAAQLAAATGLARGMNVEKAQTGSRTAELYVKLAEAQGKKRQKWWSVSQKKTYQRQIEQIQAEIAQREASGKGLMSQLTVQEQAQARKAMEEAAFHMGLGREDAAKAALEASPLSKARRALDDLEEEKRIADWKKSIADIERSMGETKIEADYARRSPNSSKSSWRGRLLQKCRSLKLLLTGHHPRLRWRHFVRLLSST
ncbi:phage tail tape measure protein [Corynebacterium renale]|uniref:phage tail tape measure protein n=1 Tax=Corynebacterium renale TaxID=1724 RepID=UPI000653D710|nr:phage tail tape measure protein [Corynebacterium renale]